MYFILCKSNFFESQNGVELAPGYHVAPKGREIFFYTEFLGNNFGRIQEVRIKPGVNVIKGGGSCSAPEIRVMKPRCLNKIETWEWLKSQGYDFSYWDNFLWLLENDINLDVIKYFYKNDVSFDVVSVIGVAKKYNRTDVCDWLSALGW